MLLKFQQNFYANLNTAVSPFAAYTFEGALLDAEARFSSRDTLRADALAQPVESKRLSAYISAREEPPPPAAYPPAHAYAGAAGAPPAPLGGAYGAPTPYGATPYAPPPPGAGYPPPPPGGPNPGGGTRPPPPPPGAPPGGGVAAGIGGYGGPPPPPGGRPRPPPPPGAPPGPPAPPPAPKGVRMRALGDYTASDARMISFSAGEVMIKEKEEGGWFYGSNSRGQQGFFPASYVEPA